MRILVVSNLFPPAFLGGYEIGASWVCDELRRRGHEVLVWTAEAAIDCRQSGFRILRQAGREGLRFLPGGLSIYGADVLGDLLLRRSGEVHEPLREVLRDFLRTYPEKRDLRRAEIEAFAPERVLLFNPSCFLDPVFAELAAIPALAAVPRTALISDDWPLQWHRSNPLVYFWREWHRLRASEPADETERALVALGNWAAAQGLFDFAFSPSYDRAAFTSRHLAAKCRPATLQGAPVEIVHWGLPGVASLPRAVPGRIADRPLRLAYCGQIQPHKGLARVLLAMVATRRPCSLVVIGDDATDYGRFCRSLVAEVGLHGRVEFTGKLPAESVPSVLAERADVLLLPSLNGGDGGFEEPFSIVLLQGMALGLAVAASRSGGSPEAIVEGETGCFLDPDDPAAIARLIDELDSDRERVARLGAAAREAVAREFTIERMVDRLLEGGSEPVAMPPGVLYLVRNATIDPANSGCVRVTRRLGRLLEDRARLAFATWSTEDGRLALLRADQAEVLSRFGGPRRGLGSVPGLDPWGDSALAASLAAGWVLLPEIMPAAELRAQVAAARARGLRSAAIFYDSIALLQPEFCNAEIRANHADYMKALAACDLVIPISGFSERCLRDFWAQEGVVPCQVSTELLPGEFTGRRIETGEPPPVTGPFRLLCVSTLEPRKNHRRLLAAFRRLAEECPGVEFELNLVGNSYAGALDIAHEVEAAAAADPRIKWWRIVDDQRLRELYLSAHATIYPSLIEGFGLPILESIWHERPCICSNDGVMYELALGGGCLATDVRDERCLAQAIALLATDAGFRRRLTEEAARRPLKTWDEYAAGVLGALGRFSP